MENLSFNVINIHFEMLYYALFWYYRSTDFVPVLSGINSSVSIITFIRNVISNNYLTFLISWNLEAPVNNITFLFTDSVFCVKTHLAIFTIVESSIFADI